MSTIMKYQKYFNVQTPLTDEQSLNGCGEVLAKVLDEHVVVVTQRIVHHLTRVRVDHLHLGLQL